MRIGITTVDKGIIDEFFNVIKIARVFLTITYADFVVFVKGNGELHA